MKQVQVIFLILVSLILQNCASSEAANIKISNSRQGNLYDNRKVDEKVVDTEIRKDQKIVQDEPGFGKYTMGLIVLSEKYGKKDFIRFYNEDGSLWYEFTFYYDDSDGEFEYSNENFKPFAFHPDRFNLALSCIREDKDRYEVTVNEESGLKKFVNKDDRVLTFETWETHILKTFAVNFNKEQNPLRMTPEGKIINVDSTAEDTFHSVEIKGEWLKVRWNDVKNKKRNDKLGWIQWRNGKNILIELLYSS